MYETMFFAKFMPGIFEVVFLTTLLQAVLMSFLL